MNRSLYNTWLIITIVLGIGATTLMLLHLVLHPGSTMLCGGDSGKNYFAYLYHSLYNRGTWFPAMNYPYGEHIVFLDGQPALSIPLSYLKDWIHINADTALAIMHLLISFSYVLAIYFVYKILLHFKVQFWLASLFSILIVIFSPQVFRVLGHFGLSYACFIPMVFYWLLQYNNIAKRKYALYIFVAGLIATFLHLYFAAMVFFFVIAYLFSYWIVVKPSYSALFKHMLPLLIAAISIFLFLKLFLYATDPVKDRPTYPWGILAYATTGEQILTSEHSPFWKFIKNTTPFKDVSEGGEGYIYLGLTTIIIFLASIITGIICLRKKEKEKLIVNKTPFSRIWLFVAFLMLLLGMGVPFVWNMEWLLNYVSAFRQFRSLGRFSWVFYYIISIYAVVVLNQWHLSFSRKNKKWLSYSIVVVLLAIWCTEVYGYIQAMHEPINYGRYWHKHFFSHDEKDWQSFMREHNKTADEYQAVLALPFFNLGTDKLYAGNDASNWVVNIATQPCMQLRLPMVEIYGSRCSWAQTFLQLRISGGPFTEKPLLQQINDKPFLLLCFKEDTLDADSKYLLQASDYIGEFSQFNVYSCYPHRIIENDKKNIAAIKQISAPMRPGDTCLNCDGSYFIEHYNNGKATHIFSAGAAKPITVEDSVIYIYSINPADRGKPYEFSAWTLLNKDDNRTPYFIFEFADSTGNIIKSTTAWASKCTDNMGMWVRASYYFTMPDACGKILLHVRNEPVTCYLAMDELLLKPANSTVISKFANGTVLANNHLLH